MCDYSLHVFPNRLAVDGEQLVVYRFGGASIGLASRADVEEMNRQRRVEASGRWSWNRIKRLFEAQRQVDRQICAVCVPPGARLLLADIPKHLQRALEVSETEEVQFVEITAESHTYRDAVRVANGRQVLLQALREGQRVTVLSLDSAQSAEPLVMEPALAS
jgi:hypothetical protein